VLDPATAKLPRLNCDGCRACCLGDTIILKPHENPKAWNAKPRFDGRWELRKGEDGNCAFLGPTGCTIHGRAPEVCQSFDCRRYALHVRLKAPADRAAYMAGDQNGVVAEGERRLEAYALSPM